MEQNELFTLFRHGDYSRLDPAAPFVTDSKTSYEAAKKIEPKLHTQLEQVYAYVKSQGRHGATRPQIAEALGMLPDSVRPRVNRLLGEDKRFRFKEDVRIRRNGENRGVYEVLEAI